MPRRKNKSRRVRHKPRIEFRWWADREPRRVRRRTLVMAPDYYLRAFALFHSELNKSGQAGDAPHPMRMRFWQFAVPRRYDIYEARQLLNNYLTAVEEALRSILSNWSIAYWLHAYRRLYPGPIGWDKTPQTIALTRAVMEAAIQKYGQRPPCLRIGVSPGIPLKRILGGLLLHPDVAFERKIVTDGRAQLVLTEFGPAELKELYDVEKLAYEVWRSAATLRSIGKGAPFVVVGPPHFFGDSRDHELDWLLAHYTTDRGPAKSPMLVWFSKT